MRLAAPALLALTCVVLAGCALPGQGFVTRSLGGTVMDVVPGTTSSARSDVYGVSPARPDDCTVAAQSRTDDAKAQGFGDDVQRQVYDMTLADCRKWVLRK